MFDESILNTIKKLLGLDPSYDAFDMDITIFINSAFSMLGQVTSLPKQGFAITGPDEKWSDLLGDLKDVSEVKTYIYLKVRMIFDPPSNSFLATALEKMIAEHEFRLNVKELVFNPNAYDRPEVPTVNYEDVIWGEVNLGTSETLSTRKE